MKADGNPVRDLHNAVARSGDPAQASTRPARTTARELRRMVSDVITKLAVDDSTSVVEIGCGTGVLAVPLARRAARFVGIDFANEATAVLRERLAEEGLSSKTDIVCLDVLRTSDDRLVALGTFDRVLVYATLHYVGDAAALAKFMERSIGLLAPNGMALFGNLPVAEVAPASADVRADRSPVRRSMWWKTSGLVYRMLRRATRVVSRQPTFSTAELPAAVSTALRAEWLNNWLSTRGDLEHEWLVPRVGTPMFAARVDLLVRRR